MFYLLAAVIVVAGFAWWQSDLTSDPPMYFAGLGQSLATDPAQYTFHARNEVLFGEWDPYDYSRWTVYQHSLTSLTAYAWFSVAGVSLRSSNMVGVFLAFGGLILLLLGVGRHHRPWVTAAVALAFVVNVTLLTHGRLSYLENGLLFLSGAVFFVYSWWGHTRRGVALAGALVAVAMLTGKMFGALLLPALVLAILLSERPRPWRRVLLAGAGFAAGFVITGLALYGGEVMAAYAYTGEQAYALRGFPDGLKSPWAFFEHLVSYGLDNRLWYLNPDLLALLLLAGVAAIQFRPNTERFSPVVRFSLFWVVCAIVGLMPLNYSPIRYTLLVIPAVIVFGFTMFDSTSRGLLRPPEQRGRWSLLLLIGLLWLGLFHLAANVFYFNTFPRPVRGLTWGTLVGAALLGYGAWRLLNRQTGQTGRRAWMVAVFAILGLVVTTNAFRIHRLHISEDNYTIAEANLDLASILGPGAVVSGPYGPALTVDTEERSFIHLFQVAEVDPELFDNNPITHLAMDVSNFEEAKKNYPELAGLEPVTEYFIRDVDVRLFRVAGLYGNATANTYEPSVYERAMAHYQAGHFDSALALAEPLHARRPECKSAGMLLADALIQTKQADAAQQVMLGLARRFPTDFHIQLQTGRFLQMLGFQSGDRAMVNLAQTYYERAVALNRYRAQYAMAMWQQTSERLQALDTGGLRQP